MTSLPGILLIGNHPPPYGGVPTHVRFLAAHLARRGWRVHVLAIAGAQGGAEQLDGYTVHRPAKRERWSRLGDPAALVRRIVRHTGFAASRPRSFLGTCAIYSFADELVRRHQLQIVSAYHLFAAGLVGAWLHDRHGLPLVTTIFGEIYADPAWHRARLREVRYVVERSARLLSCSRHCADSFARLGLFPPVEAVYYGVDVDRFTATHDAAATRRTLGLAEDDVVVLYLARMVREMGLHVLLDAIPMALAANPRLRFVIGGTRGDLTGAAEAAQLRFGDRVVVRTDIPADELPVYYAAATLVVAPSINQRACLGLALAEAMASERPVIGVSVGGTAEVVIHGEHGLLIEPESPADLARAILLLAASAPLRVAMGRLGRQRAVAQFDYRATNERMEHIFREVLA